MRAEDNDHDEATEGFVTVVTGGQLFGLRLERVRDVFVPRGISRVPPVVPWSGSPRRSTTWSWTPP